MSHKNPRVPVMMKAGRQPPKYLYKPITSSGATSSADRRATIKKRDCPTSFFLWKPLGHGFCRCRPVGGFTCAEQEAKECETAKTTRERREHRRDRIPDDSDCKSLACSDAIDQTTRDSLSNRIRNPKRDYDRSRSFGCSIRIAA